MLPWNLHWHESVTARRDASWRRILIAKWIVGHWSGCLDGYLVNAGTSLYQYFRLQSCCSTAGFPTAPRATETAGSVYYRQGFLWKQWGSGILINKKGQIYTVLSSQHLQRNLLWSAHLIGNLSSRFGQGSQLAGNDLALLQFRANGDYAVASLTHQP